MDTNEPIVLSDDRRKVNNVVDRRRSQNRKNQRVRRSRVLVDTNGGNKVQTMPLVASIATSPSTRVTCMTPIFNADDTTSTECDIPHSTTATGLVALAASSQAQSPTLNTLGVETPWDLSTLTELSPATLNDTSGRAGETALHQAVRQENVDMVRLLLNYGPSLAVQNSDGMTPLHLAALQGSKNILGILLQGISESRYELIKLDHYGRTALHCAVTSNCPQTAKIILDAGADVNATGSWI